MQNAKCKVQKKIKKYINPEIEITKLNERDVITTSPGTAGPTVDEEFDSWKVGSEF